LYSARFYYPVFTVLFLDYGLSLEQFAILNMVWALTIVLAEVPSGALADILGRKRLIVYASVLMVIEMAVLVWVPVGDSPILFLAFLVNRICSGLSEAAASGADEALAYDSLKSLGREKEWAQLLERTTRMVSIGFFSTMIIGALVYDASLVNRLPAMLGLALRLEPEWVIKLPIILTFCTACLLLWTTLGLKEIDTAKVAERAGSDVVQKNLSLSGVLEPFRQILAAGRWTINHRFVLFIILAALVLDSVARQFVVLASEYYRVIDIPTAWFGFIGAGMALIGVANARLSRYLVSHHSPLFNFGLLSLVLMAGLLGLTLVIPWFGVLFAVAAFAMMGMVSFQSSYYINREVDSAHRATVLSFRGLALNLGLGTASLLYTALIAVLRGQSSGAVPDGNLQTVVFVQSLKAFPLYFLLLVGCLAILARWLVKDGRAFVRRPGTPSTSDDHLAR
jgi:MFS family permease